jgi:hypothetical protein
MMSKVSIIMTVRNGARYLPETLEALRGQTLRAFELVVNDNGSTDETPRILADYAAQDARIRLLPRHGDASSPRTFTQGIGRALLEARAPLVAVNDCDDVPTPQRLERQAALLDTRPDVVLVGSWYDNIDAQGRLIVSHCLPTDHQELVDLYQERNALAHSSLMYRRDAALAAGGYQEHFTYASDFALQVAMAARGGKLAVVPEVLTRIRLHEAQASLMPGRRAQAYREPLEIHGAANRLPGVSARARLAGMMTRQKLAVRYGLALWAEGRRVESLVHTPYWLLAPVASLFASASTVGQGNEERREAAGGAT